MKRLHTLFTLAFLFALSTINGQTLVFTENFENVDSVTASGVPAWSVNTDLQTSGTNSYLNQVAMGDTSRLTTDAFNTTGNTFIILEFNQICKIEFFDAAIIEVSDDNGATWTQLTANEYLGSGNFGNQGNKFTAVSYQDWNPGNNAAVPDNSWWQPETFDISAFVANTSQAKVRFTLYDGNNTGANGNYGWVLDDINITMAPSELTPPVITIVPPVFSGTVYSLGPYDITAEITDDSGIDTATVTYTVNNGSPATIGMTNISGDIFEGTIPAVSDSDTVCYSITAFDASPNNNTAIEPTTGCIEFIASSGETFPYVDDFDGDTLWTDSAVGTATVWELGTPAGTVTNTAHSPPNAWDINLNGDYATDAECYLTSPVFDFSSAVNATLKFWQNRDIENSFDGLRLEYTTDGSTWQTLGVQNDPLGVNWYNDDLITSSGEPGWTGDPGVWEESEYDLSLLNNETGPVQFRFVFTSDGSVQYDGVSIDDFSITLPQPNDVGVLAFTEPTEAVCGLTASENVSVLVKNFGLDAQDSIPVTFTLDNGAPVTDTIFTTILPGDTAELTFGTTVDLSTPGQVYTFDAWTSLNADTTFENDSLLNHQIQNNLVLPAWEEDFETFGTGTPGTMDNGWTQDQNDDLDWTVQTGGTTSTNTGPEGDHTTGNGIYLYTEASGNNGDTVILVSPCIDLTQLSAPKIDFWYHMWGGDMGTLNVDAQDNSGNWVNVWSLSGDQGDQWLQASADLSQVAGIITKVRFRAITGPDFESDISIDDIYIYEPQPDDAGVTAILSPTEGNCGFSTSETVTVEVVNFGLDDQDTIPLHYTLDGGPAVVDTLFQNVPSGDTAQFTFAVGVDLSTPGQTYTLSVYTALASDNTFLNDTTSVDITNNLVLPPYQEDFESFGTGTPGTMDNGWTQEQNDNLDWTVQTGATTSSNTGPTGDHTTGSGIYLYTEASGNDGDTVILNSPCIDFTQMAAPKVDFWYHMWGGDMGTLHVDVLNNNGNWVNVWSLSGDQGNQWLQATANLSSVAGITTKLRFRAIIGPDFESDISIDDIYIYEPLPDDVGVTSILNPMEGGCGFSANESITVEVVNFGTSAQDTIPVNYQIAGGAMIMDTLFQNLPVGDTAQFTFAVGADLSFTDSTYTIDAWTSLMSDVTALNDSASSSVTNNLVIPPYQEDFETFGTGTPGTMDNGWTQAQNDDIDWTVQTGATTSTNTGPQGDHTTGSGIYLYTEASGNTGDTVILVSPCIDFTQMAAPKVDFWYHMWGGDMGTLNVDVMNSNGNWVNVWTLSGDQGNQWIQATANLSSVAGLTTRIRFRAITGPDFESDISIDDIYIYEPLPDDVGVTAILSPVEGGCGFSASEPITVEVVNFGTLDQDTIPVNYQVMGGAVVMDTIFQNLPVGDTTQFTFAVGADMSFTDSTYTIAAWSSLMNDVTTLNDSVTGYQIVHDTAVSSYPYSEDFETFLTGSPGTFMNLWEASPATGYRWQVNSGATTSSSTGPEVDHTLGNAAGIYVYTEASSGSEDDEATLTSPCIDLSGVNNGVPMFSFWYHMAGADMGALYVDIFDGSAWINGIDSIVGAQQSTTTAPWQEFNYSLLPYVGNVIKIRFRATRGDGFESDIAIDDVGIVIPITLNAATDDPSVAGPLLLPGPLAVTTDVVNLGTTSLSSVDVTLEVDGSPIVTDNLTFSPLLAQNDTVTHTFSSNWQASPGVHTVSVYTSNPNDTTDLNFPDDTTTMVVTIFDSSSVYPYCEDFESGNPPWVTLNALDFGDTGNSWEEGTPSQTTINQAHSGSNAWMTGLDTDYMTLDSSGLFTPAFEVGTDNCYKISFWHQFDTEENQDGGRVEYTTDAGNTWYYVGYAFEPTWYNSSFVTGLGNNPPLPGWSGTSDGWIYSEHNVKFDDPSQVIFRFRFGSDGSIEDEGWAIDDFCIEAVPPCEISVAENVMEGFELAQNVPNPAKGATTFRFSIPQKGEVQFEIRNILGQLIYSESNEFGAGSNQIRLSTADFSGGVYQYSVIFEGQRLTKKMLIAR